MLTPAALLSDRMTLGRNLPPASCPIAPGPLKRLDGQNQERGTRRRLTAALQTARPAAWPPGPALRRLTAT